jgi:hypothetical protein
MDIAANPGQQNLVRAKGRHRHRWAWCVWTSEDPNSGPGVRCERCGQWQDPAKSRRGLNARKRGNRRELELARKLGAEKVGHFGGPDDVRGGMFTYQSKVRAAFPTWMTAELAKLPRTGDRIPVLVVTSPPGLDPSDRRKRLAIAVVTLDDWRDLHGEETP